MYRAGEGDALRVAAAAAGRWSGKRERGKEVLLTSFFVFFFFSKGVYAWGRVREKCDLLLLFVCIVVRLRGGEREEKK